MRRTTRTDAARRRWVRALAAGGVMAGGGSLLASCGFGGEGAATELVFTHGVASGDPGPDRVVLWTRAAPAVATAEAGPLALDWEVARDRDFTQVVLRGGVSTSADRDYTVTVDVGGLMPATTYFYRFVCGDRRSPTGRTRTLPVGPVDRIRLAVCTGCDYGAGYFHVYAATARLGDVDAFVHLGDYLDASAQPTATSAELGRVVEPAGDAVTLQQYRQRHARYRSDPDLQALHAAMPIIAVWDDREVTARSWAAGGVHDPATQGPYAARRAAAMQAYLEWMPVRAPDPARPDRLYRSFDFGNLVCLHMLDTRHLGRDEPLAIQRYLSFSPRTRATLLDGAWEQDAAAPTRQLLGAEQAAWLDAGLARSGATWQLLGQQVAMATLRLPAPVVSGELAVAAYQAVLARPPRDANDERIRAYPSIPYTLANWEGYVAARNRVFATARRLGSNLVSLAGNANWAWAAELHDDAGGAVGVEFGAPAVTSPETDSPLIDSQRSDELDRALPELIGPLLKYAQTTLRGMMVITATPTECRADWMYVDTVTGKTFTSGTGRSLKVLPGEGQRRLVEV